MEFSQFATLFSFVVLSFHRGDNSLLSRFKSPNEYVARRGYSLLPDELGPELMGQLLREVPELRALDESASRRLPHLSARDREDEDEDEDAAEELDRDEYGHTRDDAPLYAPGRAHNASSTHRTPFLTRWPSPQPPTNRSQPRRLFGNIWAWRGPRVARCFYCGIYVDGSVPRSPICHDAFNSPDWRARTLARYFRANCYKNHFFSGIRVESKKVNDHWYWYDRGLKRGVYGPFYGGCYKRFLDIGTIYTVRGCRRWWTEGSQHTFVNHRYRRLEALIRKKKEACISSPHASLTPFARGVSLFARYHVCVCSRKWCNRGARARPPPAAAALGARVALALGVLLLNLVH